jgi:hypothetical protein
MSLFWLDAYTLIGVKFPRSMTRTQLLALRGHSVGKAGNRLAAAFAITKRSQMDCSRATGMRPQYITDVKTGRVRDIRVESAHKFAKFFGCYIEDLFPAREDDL